MATWAKIKFFYATMLGSAGSTLTASSTATGDYNVDYLYNMLETNMWKSNNTANNQAIEYDAGASAVLDVGVDIVVNGGFETTPTEWTPADCTIASVAGGQSGNCLEITRTAGVRQRAFSQVMVVVPGKLYRWTCYVKSGTSGDETFNIYINDSNENMASIVNTSGGAWVKYEAMFVPNESVAILNLEKWSSTAGTMLFDTGTVREVTAKTADYIVIAGHNLYDISATCYLEYSATGAWAGEEYIAQAIGFISSNATTLYEFTSVTARYWRLRITGSFGTPPYIALCIWGNKTELDYASASFDPYAEAAKANVNLTQGGYMAGTHMKFTERSLSLRFSDADSTLYNKVKAWWDVSGLKNFFVAWETANSPDDVYLMRPSTSFNNPLTNGGAYRDININLKGRKE